jgi:hypothetical protein
MPGLKTRVAAASVVATTISSFNPRWRLRRPWGRTLRVTSLTTSTAVESSLSAGASSPVSVLAIDHIVSMCACRALESCASLRFRVCQRTTAPSNHRYKHG